MATYKISAGSQYDPDGATVMTVGRLSDSWMTLNADGKITSGEPVREEDWDAVITAVAEARTRREDISLTTHVPATTEQLAASEAAHAALDLHQARMQRMMGPDGDDCTY